MKWLADHLLAILQRSCTHPGDMVAVDILEGCSADTRIAYCNRCGAVRIEWQNVAHKQRGDWRRPMPLLWRGK